jgi:hypothetical protein
MPWNSFSLAVQHVLIGTWKFWLISSAEELGKTQCDSLTLLPD